MLISSVLLLALQTPQVGHTLVAPFGSTDTHLVDEGGNIVHTWPSAAQPGNGTYLKPNGNLVRMYKTGTGGALAIGGAGGGIQEIDWAGNVVWDYQLATATEMLHHDLALMPNGNVLILSFEDITLGGVVALGRNPAITVAPEFWAEAVLELDPSTLTIVWEWHAIDHIVQDFNALAPNFDVVANRPERLNLNFPSIIPSDGDWTHCNAVDYNPALDQIVVSSPFLNEIWIVDHSTTTLEAAGTTGGMRGHGGDLLYRWGNPQSYDRGTTLDQTLFNQHDISWIDDDLPGGGHLLVMNNGNTRPGGPFSSVDEIIPPLQANGTYTLPVGGIFGPLVAVWSWRDPVPANFFTGFIGGAERQPNGNTLIINGSFGRLFEVDSTDAVVWTYDNPSGTPVFKARRYQKFLFPGDATVSASTGGALTVDLVGGSTLASRNYRLRGRLVPGPALLQRTLSTGSLDANGFASVVLSTGGPLPIAATGRTIELLWTTTGPQDFQSEIVQVLVLP